MVPGNIPIRDHRVLRWLVYNLGCSTLSRRQIELDELSWKKCCNTPWHNESLAVLDDVLGKAIESRILEIDDGQVQLADSGMVLWEKWFQPNWGESFEYSCSGIGEYPDVVLIRIAAANLKVLLKILALDLSAKEYGRVDVDSISVEDCSFFPLYWKQLKGQSIRFMAKSVPRHPEDFSYYLNASRFVSWHLTY